MASLCSSVAHRQYWSVGSAAPVRKAAARKPREAAAATKTKPLVRARSPKPKEVSNPPLSPSDASPAPKQARRAKANPTTAAAKKKTTAAVPKFFFDSDEEDNADSAAPVCTE